MSRIRSVYVITSERCSPIFRSNERPKEAWAKRSDAVKRAEQLNKKASSNIYCVYRVPLCEPE